MNGQQLYASGSAVRSKWLKCHRYSSAARMRLFCFSYAGGNASVFSQWPSTLNQDVDVVAIQLPGRSERFSEDPIRCMDTLIEKLGAEIAPLMTVPSVFFGHSNGGLIAFEVARFLQRNASRIKHIIIAAKRAPHLPRETPVLHSLSDEELMVEIQDMGAAPPDVLENKEVMELFLPMLRADFELGETFRFNPAPKLMSRASLFYAEEDEVGREHLEAWKDHISLESQVYAFSGGHFFLNDSREVTVARVNEILVKELTRLKCKGTFAL